MHMCACDHTRVDVRVWICKCECKSMAENDGTKSSRDGARVHGESACIRQHECLCGQALGIMSGDKVDGRVWVCVVGLKGCKRGL